MNGSTDQSILPTCLAALPARRRFTNVSSMTETGTLLAEYVRNGSETAFNELVARYINLVYATALRLVGGDTHFAEDVTQTVFVHLARKAHRLPNEVMLGGWLHQNTCHAAATLLRGERRREIRERQAMETKALQDSSEANLAQLAPILDEAIRQLGERDRLAIILRFFEQRDLRAVGEALGGSENAAQKRVSRALDELRVLLKRRGVVLSSAALGTALAAEAVTAAPVGLATAIAGTALAGAAASGATGFTLIKLITMTQLKLGIVGALVLAGVATPLVLEHQSQAKVSAENQALRHRLERLGAQPREDGRLAGPVAPGDQPQANASHPSSELLRLRGEVGMLRRNAQELERLKQETRRTGAGTNQDPAVTTVAAIEVPTAVSVGLNRDTPIGKTYALGQLRNAGNETIESAAQTALWAFLSRDAQGMDGIRYRNPSALTEGAASNHLQGLELQARCFDGISGVTLRLWAADGDNQRLVPFYANWPSEDPAAKNRPVGGTLVFRRGDGGWYLDQFVGQGPSN